MGVTVIADMLYMVYSHYRYVVQYMIFYIHTAVHALVFAYVVYHSSGLVYVGTLNDSLMCFRTYLRLHSRTHMVKRQAHMYVVALIRRLRQNSDYVMGLMRLN